MLILAATNETMELATSIAGSVDYSVSHVLHSTSAFTPGAAQGNITTATTTTIVAAPGASEQRQIKLFSAVNRGTAANVVTPKKDVGGTEYYLTQPITLAPSESLNYADGIGWAVVNAAGAVKVVTSASTGSNGLASSFFKIGTAPEAAGQFYSFHKDTGSPGAWAPGTPGLNGRATDGTLAADAGCLIVNNAVSGGNYLGRYDVAGTVAHFAQLADFLWVNSGLVVTTTTAQAIVPVALPARDLNGTTNGKGVMAALLVTTATTNAAVIANTTMSYTNQDGVAGRTATMSSFPATAVIGTLVFFQLQAGDTGVRSVQSVTLGTSRVAGALSLLLLTIVWSQPALLANVGGVPSSPLNPGPRLWNGCCLIPIGLMSGTGAVTIAGTAQIITQ